MKTKRTKTTQQLNFEAFLLSLGLFEFQDLGYTNEDLLLYIKPDGDKVHITDYYNCTLEVDGTDIDWEKGARRLTLDKPKTLQEALDVFLPAVFNDPDWTNEEKQEIIDGYWGYLGRLLLKAIG